jgi:Zn-dependent protease with chaperone function
VRKVPRNPRDADSTGGFAWWDPHDRARRKAALLLALVATICAAYLAAAVVAVVLAMRVGELGPWRGLVTVQDRLGPFGLAAATLGLVVVIAALIALLAVEGLARRTVRLARARPPGVGECERARRTIETFALGVGISTPRLRIVDDDAVNGFGTGRRRRSAVCLTSGALALPHDEIDALCDHATASVANRSTALACAAADLVLVADLCTKAIWALSGVILVSSVFGVPVDLVAVTTLGVAVLVVATKPLLVVADRAIERLLESTTRLADLDTVRVSHQPAALARLLLDAAGAHTMVATRWQIAHLWFDPDTRRAAPRHAYPWSLIDDDPDAVLHRRAGARRSLVSRARVIVDMTDDRHLHEQLVRVEHATRD